MATSKNSITGDFIRTKAGDQSAYADGWDRIFMKHPTQEQQDAQDAQDALDELARVSQQLGLYDNIMNAEPLDAESAKVLNDNRYDLYES